MITSVTSIEMLSFGNYYSKKIEPITSLFKFFARQLKADQDKKESLIKTNGNDFNKHLRLLQAVPDDLRKIAQKMTAKYEGKGAADKARLVKDALRKGKYQVSIIYNKKSYKLEKILFLIPVDFSLSVAKFSIRAEDIKDKEYSLKSACCSKISEEH